MVVDNTSCPQWYLDATASMFFITYYIIGPCYLVFGVALHALSLKAFRVEAKKEKGYLCQILLTISRMLMSIFTPSYLLSFILVKSNSPQLTWFRSSYWFMSIAVKAPPTFSSSGHTVAHLCSVLVSIDRMYALWKPTVYKAWCQKRNSTLIVLILVSISIGVNSCNVVKFSAGVTNGTNGTVLYEMVPNMELWNSSLGRVWVNMSSVLLLFGLVGLVSSNVGVVWLYRRSRLKAVKIFTKTSEMKKREAIEKLLILLAVSQSVCFTVSVSYKAVVDVLTTRPSYRICGVNLNNPLMIAVGMLVDLIDVACVFVINKRFRTMILNAAKCCSKARVEVTPVANIELRQRERQFNT